MDIRDSATMPLCLLQKTGAGNGQRSPNAAGTSLRNEPRKARRHRPFLYKQPSSFMYLPLEAGLSRSLGFEATLSQRGAPARTRALACAHCGGCAGEGVAQEAAAPVSEGNVRLKEAGCSPPLLSSSLFGCSAGTMMSTWPSTLVLYISAAALASILPCSSQKNRGRTAIGARP